MSSSTDPYIKVLLVEDEVDTISFVSLFLSEVKECKLFICSSNEEALNLTTKIKPDVVLYAHGLQEVDSFSTVVGLHTSHPSLYLIVSLHEKHQDLAHKYMKAGAIDCLIKGTSYIQNLVYAVKKALIRIAERESVVPPPLSHAGHFILDENVPDIVFILDLEGMFVHVNQAIVKILSYDSKELIRRPFVEIVAEEMRASFQDYVRNVLQEPKFRRMIPLQGRSGHAGLFEVNCALLEGSLIHGVARVCVDADRAEDEAVDVPSLDFKDMMPSHLGPYRVVTMLGAGSMGRVYKGYDEHLERMVAIKVINKVLADDKEYIESFRSEAKLLAKMTHPNIALIYYFGNLEGLPFFCMEYLPGGSLENLLQVNGKLDPETAISYTLQVALGLKQALKKGIIHLDIKPSNLMIAENNRIKIVDFGLARKSHETEGAMVTGTPFYIAPEQFQGEPPDHRCDIYSLGVTFFRMLYGKLPYSGKSMMEVFHQQRMENLPPRELLDPSVPPHVHEIVQRMISSDPQKRLSDYGELIRELERFRRVAASQALAPETVPPPVDAVAMRGLIFDQPFAEIVGEILQRDLSGKLTLSWMDLCKTVHFKDGKITAVLSNQEGERFVDLLLEKHQLSGKKARKLESGSFDLMTSYFSLAGELAPGVNEQLKGEVTSFSWQILQGLFPWMMGEFIFEEGNFQGQHGLQIGAGELLMRGVKEWQDISLIKEELLEGRCQIQLQPEFEERLKKIPIQAADSFLLFRFDKSILFQDLFLLSGIPEQEFYRLIYLFACAGIIRTTELKQKRTSRPSASELKPPTMKKPETASTVKPVEPNARKAVLPETKERPPSLEESAAYYARLAGQSFRNQNYYATVEYCKKALEHKKDAGIYELMGDALATHPKFRFEAMEAYKKALEMNPGKVLVHRSIADLYFSTGNYALARSKYQEVLKMIPEDPHSIDRLKDISRRYKG